MPAKSRKQQQAMAIAEHNPSQLYPADKSMLSMSKPQLHDFAATPTTGLPAVAVPATPAKKRRPPVETIPGMMATRNNLAAIRNATLPKGK